MTRTFLPMVLSIRIFLFSLLASKSDLSVRIRVRPAVSTSLQVKEKRRTYERMLKIYPENSRDEQLPLTVKMMICLHGADESKNLSFATTVDVSAYGGVNKS